jgi:ParB family chromosome partitioning protein
LIETIAFEEATPSLAQAIKMRDFSKNGKLNEDVILSIISEEKPNHGQDSVFLQNESASLFLTKFLPNNRRVCTQSARVLPPLPAEQRELER